jgi:two-component system cell cycle sensor histidine kinase/response regulator CckA
VSIVPGDGPLCIRADSGQVEQVLMNLVVNAVDAMPGQGRVEVETRAVNLGGASGEDDPDLAPGAYVLLRVTDTGCGMPPEVQQCAFDPFFSTKQGQGTGLGLSTVYGIVQQSGGVIRLESEAGIGTTFRMFFPRVQEQDAGIQCLLPTRDAGTETLLLVEDEPYVRKIVCRALERSGHRVLLASSGEEALEVFAHFDGVVDLLVTDVVMPGMSGADLARQIRARQQGVRVLFMSGYTDEVISRHGVLDPGIDFIQKPFSPATLVTRVREVINGAIHG